MESRPKHPHARRALKLFALSLAALFGCEDPFTNGSPPDSPGVAVAGLSDACPTGFACTAWSADSKTLYIVATIGTPGVVSLVAIDPATLTFRVVGAIDPSAVMLVPSPDGTTMYFEVPDRATPVVWILNRMSLSDGTTTAMTKTRVLNFLVSADGSALAYHALGTATSADTIAVLALPSGTRRATTVTQQTWLEALSPDGARLLMSPLSSRDLALHVWHTMTGVRDTIPIRMGALWAAAWSGGDFRMLFSGADSKTFTDTSLGGGSARIFSLGQAPVLVGWLADRAAMWTVPANEICGPQDCQSKRFDFVYTTPTRSVTVGAVKGRFPLVAAASPDGQWMAHAENSGPLYFLKQRTP